MKKLCVVTGTRAEYGLLKPLIKRIEEDGELKLQIIATGMHLSSEFGLTYKEIEDDGFYIDEKVEMLLSSDSAIGISKSMGLAMISFAESLERLKPDALVVLGDRYEIFSAVSSALVSKIPVIHLYGGETTEGAFDEAFRHSITKMSHLHFTSTEKYKQRVIQLGENPSTVFNVGAIGIENIKTLKLLTKKELESNIAFGFGERTALVTFHPVSLEKSTSEIQFKNLLDAVDDIKNLKLIFTKANSDTDGRIINKMIDDYVSKNSEKAIAFTSMGLMRYLSAMKYSNVVIGNSSSGIAEAPTFKVPTVNIGDRQKGRIKGDSVIDCEPVYENIHKSIIKALSTEFNDQIGMLKNPYGDGEVSSKIIIKIKESLNKGLELKKIFYDI